MADAAKVYRYEVPVDDCWHEHDLSGAVLHVAGRDIDTVEIWALHSGGPTVRRAFRVFGTGHPLPPDHGSHIGTVVHQWIVWHLFERAPQ